MVELIVLVVIIATIIIFRKTASLYARHTEEITKTSLLESKLSLAVRLQEVERVIEGLGEIPDPDELLRKVTGKTRRI